MSLQRVSPGQKEVGPNVLDVGGLEVIQLLGEVRCVIQSESEARPQMDLVGLQQYGFVNSFHELGHRGVDATLDARVLSNLVLDLFQQVAIQLLLRTLHFLKHFHDISFSGGCSCSCQLARLSLSLCHLLHNPAILRQEVVGHLLKLLLLPPQVCLDSFQPGLLLDNLRLQVSTRINIGFL